MKFKKFITWIFSLTNEDTNKVLIFFGIKIKFRNRYKWNGKKIDECSLRMEHRAEELDCRINGMYNTFAGRTQRAYLRYFEAHLTDHCNMNCKGCSHYCPLVKEPVFADINEFSADIEELSAKLVVEEIRLLGGEPLLHPDAKRFMTATRSFFPHAIIRIITNGILLPKMDDEFWRTMRENDISIDMSCYPPLRDKHEEYRKLARENDIKLRELGFFDRFGSSLNSKGDSDMRKSYRQCHDIFKLGCYNLRHGKMMVCPEACFLDIYNKYFDENIPYDMGIDIYENSGEEIVKYLKTPHETCRYCTPRGRTFEWRVSAKEKSEWDVNAEV